MTNFETAAQERAATDLADRTVRALTDYLLVVEAAPGLFRVYGEDGDEYTVDVSTGACTCPDAEYRAPDGGCKHVWRVAFHTGERAGPAWVDRDAVDPLLVEQLADSVDEDGDAQAQAVATDGGQETATCPECGDTFIPDPSGREDRTELNLGKPAGYCGLACRLVAGDGGDDATDGGEEIEGEGEGEAGAAAPGRGRDRGDGPDG